MRKRPLCAICILFLVIQSIRVLFFGVEEMEPSALEKALSYGKRVELAGTVYKIEEKKKVMAVFLKDNIASVADQIIKESDVLIYISKNKTEQSTKVRIGNRLKIGGEAESFENARNPGNFDQKAYYLRQGIHVLVWADQVSIQSYETDPVANSDSSPIGEYFFNITCPSLSVNISRGSPSLILNVFLISFGITTLPKSSILLTTPVAFIIFLLFVFRSNLIMTKKEKNIHFLIFLFLKII